MPILSIIVPVYNSEQFLEVTVGSILKQTFKDFELILVNDGSTDNSLQIMKKLAELDGRIVVLDKKNGGVSSARNRGLSYSTGKYIGFVDSDDLIEQDMYEILIHDLEKHKADMACTRFGILSNNLLELQKDFGQKNLFLDNIAAIAQLCENGLVSLACWDKLYRGEIARKIKFNESLRYVEDSNWVLDYLLMIKTVVLNNKVKYIYTYQCDSAVHRELVYKQFIENMLDGYYLIYNKIVNNKLDKIIIGKAYNHLYYGEIIMFIKRALVENKKEVFNQLQKRLIIANRERPQNSISKMTLLRHKRFLLPYCCLKLLTKEWWRNICRIE